MLDRWWWLILVVICLSVGACTSSPPPATIVVLPPTLESSVARQMPQSIATATIARISVPTLVWIPFAEGVIDDSPTVLVVRDGIAGREPSPAAIRLFWDYSAESGELAYASQFWHSADGSDQSVSDLWVYDYTEDNTVQWLSDYVAGVAWSPRSNGTYNSKAAVAFLDSDTDRVDLIVVSEPSQVRLVTEYASRFFSWSPDGERLAFVRLSHEDLQPESVGLYVVPALGGEAVKLSDFSYESGGWIGDHPLWVSDQQALIVADAPLRVIPLDGSGDFAPSGYDGKPLDGPRPDVMLWDQDDRQLVISGEAMFGNAVWIHAFSLDLRVVEGSELLTDGMLVGWWVPGESVLVIGSDGVQVLTLPRL